MGARRQDQLMAMCLFPSINFTPVKYVLPVPYPVFRMLENSVDTAAISRFNEENIYTLDQTVQPDCFGDFLGQGKGIFSQTVSDEVKPTSSSDSIIVEGKLLIRKGDKCTLNKANTFGKYTSLGSALSGLAHLALGALSFLPPPFGSIAALADGALYLVEGDSVGAALSFASAIPGGAYVAAAAKIGKGLKAAVVAVKLGPAFSKGGAWIKGFTKGLRVKPCTLSKLSLGFNIASSGMGLGYTVYSMFGSPVHAIRGAKVLMDDDDLDYQGLGYLPFYLQRIYNSQNDNVGWFGQGWTAQGFEQRLEIEAQQNYIYLVDNSGRRVPFTYLTAGQSCYNPFEDITLYRLPHSADEQQLTRHSQPIEADAVRGSRIGEREPLRFMLINGKHTPKSTGTLSEYSDFDGIAQYFSHISTLNSRGTKATVLPSKQVDRYGHTLQLHYTHSSHHAHSKLAHLPQYITDAGGDCYRLNFEFINDKPRLKQLEQIQTTGARLTSAALAATELATYTYDKAGDLTHVHRHKHLVRQFKYTNHLMTWQQLPTGLEGNYVYDQTEQPKSARVIDHTLSNGLHYRFDYDTDDTNENDNALWHTIVTEQPNSDLERQHHYRYDDWYILKSYTNPQGRTISVTHDHLDRPIRIQDPKGGHSKYHYHGSNLGSVSTKVGVNPITGLDEYRTTRYQYNGKHLVAIQDPMSNTDRLSYNDTGELITHTDANGQTTRYRYDNHGNLVEQTLANGSHFDYTFDDTGKLIVQSDCSGYQTHYNYDDKQRLATIVDAKQQTTRYHYDDSKPWLHLINHIDAPDGSHIHLQHDDAGRLTSITDAKDQQTTYHYDKDNLPTKRIDALGHSLSYHYDSLRRLSTLTNENGEDWTFQYDKGDNLISETRFDDHQSRYDYDPLGMLVTQIDNPQLPRHKQRHVRYQRDLIGQLIAKHSSHYANDKDNAASKQTQPDYRRTRYQYNLAGQLISASNPHSRSHLTYDQVGQLIEERTTSHLTLNGQYQRQAQTLTHDYDEIGNRIATTLPCGKVINQLYYGSGHLYNQSLTDPSNDNSITEIRHSERNTLHQEIVREQGVLTSAYDYDPMGRLTKQYSSTESHIAIERHYNYDVLGQLTHLTGHTRITHGQHSRNPSSIQQRRGHQYQYDSIGRLTEHKLINQQQTSTVNQSTVNQSITEHFAFDPASNRVPVNAAVKEDKDKSKTNGKQGRPTELTTHDKYLTYTYDSHGRVLYKTQTPLGKDGQPLKQSGSAIVGFRNSLQLAYNADHELTQSISITQQGIDTTVITTDYHYDAFGRRTHKHSETKQQSRRHPSGKILISPVQTQKTKQNHTSYLWDGNRQLQQNTATHTHTIIYEQDSFEPVAQFIWLRDGLTAANDEPESYQENQEGWYGNNKPVIKTGVQLYHYHNDHLGTPNELTDQQGDVVWYADYEAWGNTATVEWKSQRIDNIVVSEEHLQPIRFQGQSFDTETGLHYNRFRYFDPDMGMFTTRDPIGLDGGMNVFQYAPNPTGWIDPFGLANCMLSAADRRGMGPEPSDMSRPHRHHIVREKAPTKWSTENQKLITEAQDVLGSHNIDVNTDPRNFVWAENGSGVHTIESAKKVHTSIMAAAKDGLEGVEKALGELGTMFNQMR